MIAILVQSEWGGCGLPGEESSNIEPRTRKDTHNTIADVGVTIEELAFWRVRLTHLQDNHKFWIPYYRTSFVWAFFLLPLRGIEVDVEVPQTMRCVCVSSNIIHSNCV